MRCVGLVLALILASPAGAQTPPADAANVLLRSAWLWQSKERPDLARLALEKLQNVSPNHPQGLLELGLLNLRSGQADEAARLLQRLRTTHPNHPATLRLTEAHRLATRDRFQMMAIRRLDESGESQAAIAGLRKLFPNGPPAGELGIEYYQILAGGPGGRAKARAGLTKLMKDNPGDPRYPLALAAHLLKRPETRNEGFRLFAQTSREYDLHQPTVLRAWREGLQALPNAALYESLYRDYLAAVPDDPEVKGLLERANDPAVVALQRGLTQISRNQLPSAEEAMGLAYSKRPDDPEVLRGLALLRARQGRHAEARELYTKARAREPAPRVRARVLLDQAELDISSGQLSSARTQLETALELDPENPWARYDLARLYVRLGQPRKGRELMAQGVAGPNPNPEGLYAQAIFLAGLDDYQAVLSALNRVAPKERTRKINDLAARSRTELRRRQVLTAAATGDFAEVERLLVEAEKKAGNNPERLAEVASIWMDLGYTERGLALLRPRADAQSKPTAALLLAYAALLDRARLDAELQPLLERLDQQRRRGELNSAQRAALAELETNLALRRAEALSADGRYDEGLALLRAAEDKQTQDRELRIARAELLTDAGEFGDARALYSELQQEKPRDLDTRLSWARFLRKSGDFDAARAEYDAILGQSGRGDVDARLSVARGYLALDELESARAITDSLRAATPNDPSVLVHSGRVEAADGHYPLALEYYRKAQAIERRKYGGLAVSTPGNLSAADDELLRLERRRHDGYVSVGLDYSSKPGDPGVSRLTDAEIPVDVHLPVGYESRLFLRADPVRLDAGTLSANYDIAGLYGQVQANGPGALALFPNGVDQNQQGVMAGVGFENKHWRADLGTTPTSFPVHYLVGGVRYEFDAGELGGAVEVSRRPVTASLVSYSGAYDPVSGEIWGGVRSTGASLLLTYGDGALSHFGRLGAYRLTGENVLPNSYVPLRIGSDWRLLARGNMEFSIGWAGTYWYYKENQRYYTFGHGGYYSPQSYASLAIPLDWSGRVGRLAYHLRGTGTYARSDEDSELFYPTRPDLQALAVGQPLPANQGFTAPVYDGGPGRGSGYALTGALEYEMHPHLFIGASAAMDRSEFYEPDFYTLYLRYHFTPWVGPVNYPPRPPTPYSRF